MQRPRDATPRRTRGRARPGTATRGLAVAVLAALALAQPALAAAPDSTPPRLYEDAVRHFNGGDLEATVIALKEALSADPGLLPAHVLMARVFLRIAEPAAAEEYVRRARRLGADPNIVWPLQAEAMYWQRQYEKLLALTPREGLEAQAQAAVLVFRGRARLEQGKYDEATEEFRQAAALTPSAPLPHVSMAITALRAGDVHAAEARAIKAIRVAPEDAEAWTALGDVAHVQGRLAQAVEAYDRALASSPDHFDARLSRAGIHLDTGELEQAAEDIATLRERAPLEPRPAYLESVLLAKQGRTALAREALERAATLLDEMGITVVEQSMQYVLLAGLANFELGELEQAQGQLARYVERFPHQPGPRKLLGAILVRKQRSAEAITVLEPALERAPADWQLLSLVATAYMQRERYDLAQGYLQRAVDASGGRPELRAKLALARIGNGYEADGMRELAAVFESDPVAHGSVGITLAALQLRRSDPAGALATAARLHDERPRNVHVLNLLGAAQLGLGRVPEARASFEAALAIDPDHLPARINLGKLEIAQGNLDAARQVMTQVVAKHPESTLAMVELARVEERLGQGGESLRWLQKALGTDPKSLPAAIALVDLHLSAGNHVEAMRVVKETETFAPEDPDVLETLARVHIAAGREDLALGVYKRMSLLAGFDGDSLMRIARLQARIGAPDEAMFTLYKALRNDAGHVDARLLLARLQVRSGKLEEAREQVAKLLEQAPGRAEVYQVAGDAAMAARDAATAAMHFARAMAIAPDTTNALRLYGARLTAGEVEGALAFLDDWAAKHPEDVAARQALAETLLARGELEQARRRYEQALEMRPADAGMLNNMAYILDAAGDPAALDYAERALAAAPEDPAVLDTLGWLLVRRGEPARGLGYLRDAHSRASGNPEIRYHIASALVALDRQDEARRELRLALQAPQPFDGMTEARALLERLGP